MSSGVMLMVLAVVAVGILQVVVVLVRSRKRRQDITEAARQRGWSLVERDDRWASSFRTGPFARGRSRHCRNVLSGTYDRRQFVAFDYSYVTSTHDSDGGSSSTTHRFSVVGLNMAAAIPTLEVTPQGMVGRFFGKLLGTDVLVGDPEFDDAFKVGGESQQFTLDVLQPEVRSYLMSMPFRSWYFDNGWLLCAERGEHSVAQVDATLAGLDGFLDRLPQRVWDVLGRTDPGRG